MQRGIIYLCIEQIAGYNEQGKTQGLLMYIRVFQGIVATCRFRNIFVF